MKPTTSRPLRKQTNAVPSSGGSRPSDKGWGGGGGGGGGGGHPDPEIRWGPVSKIFWPFAPQCGLEIRRGDPPLDPPLPSVL